MHRGKPLVLETTETGCIVPTSHKLNKDGYFRYRGFESNEKGRKKLVMYHRLVWERAYGTIPEGCEIDHICRNRACCNLAHLQCLEGHEHTVKGNKLRYKERKEDAYVYWLKHQCTGTKLAKEFGVSFSIGCRWIRDWKAQRLSERSRDEGENPSHPEAPSICP